MPNEYDGLDALDSLFACGADRDSQTPLNNIGVKRVIKVGPISTSCYFEVQVVSHNEDHLEPVQSNGDTSTEKTIKRERNHKIHLPS